MVRGLPENIWEQWSVVFPRG